MPESVLLIDILYTYSLNTREKAYRTEGYNIVKWKVYLRLNDDR